MRVDLKLPQFLDIVRDSYQALSLCMLCDIRSRPTSPDSYDISTDRRTERRTEFTNMRTEEAFRITCELQSSMSPTVNLGIRIDQSYFLPHFFSRLPDPGKEDKSFATVMRRICFICHQSGFFFQLHFIFPNLFIDR